MKGDMEKSQVDFKFCWDCREKLSISDLFIWHNSGMIQHLVSTKSGTILRLIILSFKMFQGFLKMTGLRTKICLPKFLVPTQNNLNYNKM